MQNIAVGKRGGEAMLKKGKESHKTKVREVFWDYAS